jgi:hypothetical protein
MKLFGQVVRTLVNVATLPVAVLRDCVSLGGAIDNEGRPHTADALDQLKREATESGKEAT